MKKKEKKKKRKKKEENKEDLLGNKLNKRMLGEKRPL